MLDFADIILLIILIILVPPHLPRWQKRLHQHWTSFKQRQWKPATPHDCPLCCHQLSLDLIQQRAVVPYCHTKSLRGRKKTVSTHGFACPNPACHYCGIIDDAFQALVGYGHHNRIPRFKCQACCKVFTSRAGTPLY